MFFATQPSFVTVFALAVLSIPIAQVIYNRYIHPLSRYPGPFWWTTFRLPFVICVARGNYAHDMKKFHDKYGKIVRVAPNELSFIDSRAWQDIYGHQKVEFPKNPIWAQKALNGVYSIMNAGREDHARIRKMLLPAFGPRGIRDSEDTIQYYVGNLMKQLKIYAASDNPVVDMKDYFSWTTFDIVGDLGFGEPFDCLKYERYHFWVALLFSHLKAATITACLNYYPGFSWMTHTLQRWVVFKEQQEHQQQSSEKLSRRMSLKTDRKDLISYILTENRHGTLSVPELEATSSVLILAGSEGVSTCLIATGNLLLRNPEKLEKLVTEIRSTFQAESDITLDRVEKLPYMKAVLQESLRINPPLPIGIPRVVPTGGATVAGEFIPGNTFVSVPQFAASRFDDHFAFADRYLPERWIDSSSELFKPSSSDPKFTAQTFAQDDRKVFQPFSVGPRDCIGKTLAYPQMKILLARLFWNFDLKIPTPDGKNALNGMFRPFEHQKSFALWQRWPSPVEISLAR